MATIYTADKIFTGSGWLLKHAIVEEDGMITAIVPVVSPEKKCSCFTFSHNRSCIH